MDLAVSLWEKNMIFACQTIAHGANLRRSPQILPQKITGQKRVPRMGTEFHICPDFKSATCSKNGFQCFGSFNYASAALKIQRCFSDAKIYIFTSFNSPAS